MTKNASLQWGRDLSIAEMARKNDGRPCLTMLQWGRDLSIAEMQTIPAQDAPTGVASMGPRSLDRGNSNGAVLPYHQLLLQWGRDLSIAEIRVVIP